MYSQEVFFKVVIAFEVSGEPRSYENKSWDKKFQENKGCGVMCSSLGKSLPILSADPTQLLITIPVPGTMLSTL